MDILSIVLKAVSGLISLLFGRRFFWLFLAIVGFIGGFFVGASLFPNAGTLVHILLGLILGVVGALLSQVAPVVIAAIVGFFAGGAALVALANTISDPSRAIALLILIVGGALSAYLVTKAFNSAIVVISSISGAAALSSLGTEHLNLGGTIHFIIFLVLFVIGILFQFNLVKPHEEQE